MSLGKSLAEFASWLSRESACAPTSSGPQSSSGADITPPFQPKTEGGGRLGRFLELHPPGGLDTSQNLNAERAPLLLSFTRHRRVPINWLSVLESSTIASGWGAEGLRRRIETIWLLESGQADKIPSVAIDAAKAADLDRTKFSIRLFYPDGLQNNHLFTEAPIPEEALLVSENKLKHENPKAYALIPNVGKTLGPGSPWTDVREGVEIFPRGQTDAPWAQQLAATLRDALKGGSIDWPFEPSALPVLSSRVSARALSGRLGLEWRSEQLEQQLSKYVVRTSAPGDGGEAYWKLDELKRTDLLKAQKGSLGQILANRSTLEPQYLDKLTLVGDWIIKVANRRYLIEFRSELSSADKSKLDLRVPVDYATAWEKHIKGLVPLAWSTDPNKPAPDWTPFGYLHSIDLSPQLIVEEFAKLKAAYDVAIASSELGDAILAKFKEMVDLDPGIVSSKAEFARVLKSQAFQPRWRILTLKQRAAKLGYVLATGFDFNGLKDNEVFVPVGPGKTEKKQVAVGRLYSAEEQVATYSVTQSENVTTWGVGPLNPFGLGSLPLPGFSLPGLVGGLSSGLNLGILGGGFGGIPIPGLPLGGLPIPGLPGIGIGPQRHRRDYAVNVSVRYTDLREISVDAEPWEETRQQLQQAGFKCLMAELSERGYLVDGDIPLREILGRCAVDEEYRQSLAVFVPIYQQSFDEGLVKVRYVVAIRPEPGIDPVGFPSILCAEDLSYKAEWRGTEIGELLHSVSLAPGEEREVTISRTIERKTERIDSITAALDVTKTDKLDLQSSIQETFTKEQNSKSTSNWNVNASASVGWFSGGGGASGGSETSVRDFAETIKKSAMQSTREMRINQKQEIKSSTTSSSLVSTVESTKASFRNINQGRTLNVQFYQVNNVHKAGLVLEALRLTYVPSVELIQGLGIHDTLTFQLRDLGALLACANNDVALTGGDFVYDVPALERRLLRTVVRTILREYAEVDELPAKQTESTGENAERITMAIGSLIEPSAKALGIPQNAVEPMVAVLGLLQDSLKHTDVANADGVYSSTLEECQKYIDLLTRLYSKGQVLDPHSLTVPSTATYAEASVGELASTEPYSERMREAEIELKYAEIEGKYSEAAARRSVAGVPMAEHQTISAELDRTYHGKLRIQAMPPLEKGDWAVFCDSTLVHRFRLAAPSALVEVAPTGEADWPRDGGHRWELVSPRLGRRFELSLF